MSLDNQMCNLTSLTDLLGSTKPGVQDIRSESDRTYQRPTYELTERLRQEIQKKVQSMSMDNIRQFVARDVPAGLEAIATSQMPLADLINFYEMISVINEDRANRLYEEANKGQTPSQKHMYEGPEKIMLSEFDDDKRLDVARYLAYSVAFNEGLFGPTNAFGYIPDQAVGLYRKEEKIMENIVRAVAVLAENPDMYGQKNEEDL